MKEKTKGVRTLWNKYKYVALVALAGMVLLLWPTGRKQQTAERAAERNLQSEMESILTKISGVGKVEVMLTEESDGERKLAQDTKLQYSGETSAPEDYSRTSETVLLDGTAGDETVVLQQQYPTYRGALVVCEGGGRAEVKLAVTAAVAALTGLSADKITVAEWQSSYGGGTDR